MLKVDLHLHTSDDPHDFVPYTTIELIDRAAALGFGALAITLHDRQRDLEDVAGHARGAGIVLIPGIERTIERRHVLLLNFPPETESVETFADLAALRMRHPEGLVVAPHPFYPLETCLRGLLDRHADLIDAVEINAFHTEGSGCFNRAAVRWARAHGKPVVGNSDAHRLSIFGATFSLVDLDAGGLVSVEPHFRQAAPTTPDAICSAIRNGHVEARTRPLPIADAGIYLAGLVVGHFRPPRRVQTPSAVVPTLSDS